MSSRSNLTEVEKVKGALSRNGPGSRAAAMTTGTREETKSLLQLESSIAHNRRRKAAIDNWTTARHLQKTEECFDGCFGIGSLAAMMSLGWCWLRVRGRNERLRS
jgi:hypothetical protein